MDGDPDTRAVRKWTSRRKWSRGDNLPKMEIPARTNSHAGK